MSVAVIVNTAALGPQSRDVLSSGKVPHKARVKLLENVLLPRLCAEPLVDEVVVVGEWRPPEPDERWLYIPNASQNFDCTDALAQRQAGAEFTTSRLLVFLHDDHVPASDFFKVLVQKYANNGHWDVLVPERRCWKGDEEVLLNNGRMELYVMGHACVMRREIWQDVPWTDVPQVFTWDIGHTLLLRKACARIEYVNDLIVYDAETTLGAEPWR